MNERFLYEVIVPALVIIVISALSAEFIGRRKHIGGGFTFFMMLGLIPGILGLIFSPSAKNNPTKASSGYLILGIFLIISGLFSFFQGMDNLTFVHLFALISQFSSAFYCFELSQGNVINRNPKFYFESETEQKNNKQETTYDVRPQSLKDLTAKGILTPEEYNQKVSLLEKEILEKKLMNSEEYKQLKNLHDTGILTKEEYINKIIKLQEIFTNNLISEDDYEVDYDQEKTIINITVNDIIGRWEADDSCIVFNANHVFQYFYNKNISQAEVGTWSLHNNLKKISIVVGNSNDEFNIISMTRSYLKYGHDETIFEFRKVKR